MTDSSQVKELTAKLEQGCELSVCKQQIHI